MNKSFSLTDWVRPNIQELTSYTSAVINMDKIKAFYSTQMSWAWFCHPKSPNGDTDPSDSLHRYPDPYQRKLRVAIAKLRVSKQIKYLLAMAVMKRLTLSFGCFVNLENTAYYALRPPMGCIR